VEPTLAEHAAFAAAVMPLLDAAGETYGAGGVRFVARSSVVGGGEGRDSAGGGVAGGRAGNPPAAPDPCGVRRAALMPNALPCHAPHPTLRRVGRIDSEPSGSTLPPFPGGPRKGLRFRYGCAPPR